MEDAALNIIVSDSGMEAGPNTFVLTHSTWNDWWEFETQYFVEYFPRNGKSIHLGVIKIGWAGRNEGKIPNIPSEFISLSETFYSLGQDESFYTNVMNLRNATGMAFLRAVNDVALRTDLFAKHKDTKVMTKSLMRFVSEASVVGQYRRIVSGGKKLAKFNARYIERATETQAEEVSLPFLVSPDAVPPSNIHVLIGRNGSGKTRLLRRMAQSLIDDEPWADHVFEIEGGSSTRSAFSGVGFVSFSAFDRHTPLRPNVPGFNVFEVGLKKKVKVRDRDGKLKTAIAIKNYRDIELDMGNALNVCLSRSVDRWERAVETLESDPQFRQLDVTRLLDGLSQDGLSEEAGRIFGQMSSGHQVVLLTITQLVARLEERTLVLMDEPEGHLHPPLLASLIRAMSTVLGEVNAFAIVATHSPVILQANTCGPQGLEA
jgi:ABC-type transport system involved in cytochrome c biogenesis ATPase subunit